MSQMPQTIDQETLTSVCGGGPRWDSFMVGLNKSDDHSLQGNNVFTPAYKEMMATPHPNLARLGNVVAEANRNFNPFSDPYGAYAAGLAATKRRKQQESR